MTVAWVFPGQGSQKIGMAKQIENLPNAKRDLVMHLRFLRGIYLKFVSQILNQQILSLI